MHRFRSFRSSAGNALAALLMLALLASQWSGLQHRIAHAVPDSLRIGAVHLADHGQSASDGSDADIDFSHSCKLFDAAALGAALHSPFLAARCTGAPSLRLTHARLRSRALPFAAHFSSRAPPLA